MGREEAESAINVLPPSWVEAALVALSEIVNLEHVLQEYTRLMNQRRGTSYTEEEVLLGALSLIRRLM